MHYKDYCPRISTDNSIATALLRGQLYPLIPQQLEAAKHQLTP